MADITSNLIAYWSLEEGTGTSTTADVTGNGHTGTLINSPTWVAGQVETYALDFNGSDEYITVADASDLNITGGITIAAWVEADDLSVTREIVCRVPNAASTNAPNYILRQRESGKLRFTYRNSTDTAWHEYQTDNVVFSVDTLWHHVAVSFTFGTGSSIKLYYDGSVVTLSGWVGGNGNEAPYTTNGTIQTRIGAQGSTSLWDGMIDDVRIYTRALAADDIAALYAYTGGAVLEQAHYRFRYDDGDLTSP